jgi:hypothetical protein
LGGSQGEKAYKSAKMVISNDKDEMAPATASTAAPSTDSSNELATTSPFANGSLDNMMFGTPDLSTTGSLDFNNVMASFMNYSSIDFGMI